MPVVEVTREVRGSVEAVMQRLWQMETWPQFMDAVDSIEILERDGRRQRSRWRVHLKGTTIRWEEEDEISPEEGRLVYRQTVGDLRKFQGVWQVAPSAAGATVTHTLEFEFGIPMLAGLLNPIAKVVIKSNTIAMLDGLVQSFDAADR